MDTRKILSRQNLPRTRVLLQVLILDPIIGLSPAPREVEHAEPSPTFLWPWKYPHPPFQTVGAARLYVRFILMPAACSIPSINSLIVTNSSDPRFKGSKILPCISVRIP